MKKYKSRNVNFSKVRVRDNNVCQKCGRLGEKYILEVHHKKAYANGGSNDMDNLILLCNLCHKYAPEDGIEDFDSYLIPPLPPVFSLVSVTLNHFYFDIIGKVSGCFGVKGEIDCDNNSLKATFTIPKKCKKKLFLELYNSNYSYFYLDNLVEILNFGKSKCRGYKLWKKLLKEKRLKKK